jgi:hypothetical protein
MDSFSLDILLCCHNMIFQIVSCADRDQLTRFAFVGFDVQLYCFGRKSAV